MNQPIWILRSMVALLLVVLGLSIAGRGLLEGAPLAFTGMGGLMAVLGAYRLRLMLGWRRQQ